MERGNSTKRSVAGRYSLLEQLGAGGMGAVYRARDEVRGREVAFKQLHSSEMDEQRRRAETLFEREYYTLARLKHPRIIEVYDFGRSDEGPFYTMELLDGQDLLQRAPLPYRELCRHLCDVASSLALLHAHRLVHRDVSPRNVRFTEEGRAKLIDFGALAPFGVARELVGTPMCIAPEIMQRLPLDARSDLFALGAIGYLGLTGRPPYAVQKLEDVHALWQTQPTPPPPSHFAPDVPSELDALILSLLKIDPTARPGSAAVVIDQLAAIAGLELEEHGRAAESYLSSGQIVGREEELAWLERRVERLQTGRGTELLLEGAAGVGKSRLLREFALRARLRGLAVLEVDAQAVPQAFGVAAALAGELLASCGDDAREAAGTNAEVLSQLSAEVRARLGTVAPEPAGHHDPGEHRARLQTALYEWYSALLARRPLVLAIDNLHAADDSSVAFLAALGPMGRENPLLVVATQRVGAAIAAAEPLNLLRQRAGRLKLAGLRAEAYEALTSSLFGNVANTGRVARLLYDKSAGNPQRCMELLRLLMKHQIVKYGAGAWVLPSEVSAHELPDDDEGLILARMSSLGAASRTLLEALSVHTRPASIDTCRALAPGWSDAEFHAALSELTAEQLLVESGGRYGFEQEGARHALLRHLDEATRREHHRRAAAVLLSANSGAAGDRIEAGFHLLRAGDEQRGADILVDEGRTYLATQCGAESGKQAVEALSAALAIYRKQGRSDYEIGRVLLPMLPLAYFEDWRLVLEQGEGAVALGLRLTGLGLARKLRPFTGRKLALLVGLGTGFVRFTWQRLRGLDYGLLDAIAMFCAVVPSVTGVVATSVNIPRNLRVRAMLEPFTYFEEKDFPRLVYDYLTAFIQINSYDSQIVPLLERTRTRFFQPKIKAVLGEGHWKAMYGGVPLLAGLMSAFGFGKRALAHARELDELGVRVWSMAADNVRLLYYAIRGESEQMQHYLERIDRFAVQGSTTWQAEMYLPLFLINAYVLSGDTLATRRVWEQFSRWSKEVPSLQIYANLAHAAYLSLRGDREQAVDAFEQLLPAYPVRKQANWQSIRNYYAHALNELGRHAQAKTVVLEALAAMDATDREWAAFHLEAQRQLALAEAGLGNTERSLTLLDSLLAEHGHEDNALLVGLLHQARAELALRMRDEAAFRTHFEATRVRFYGVKNHSLIAQCERLAGKAARAGLVGVTGELVPANRAAKSQREAVVGELERAEQPREAALEILMREAQARSGHLYLRVDGERYELTRSRGSDAPPAELEHKLLQLLARASVEASEAARALETVAHSELGQDARCSTFSGETRQENTMFVESVPPLPDGASSHELLVLDAGRAHEARIVGGVILERDPTQRIALYPEFLEALAAALLARDRTKTAA